MADDSQILQREYTRVWMWPDFGSVQLYSARSTQNFGEFSRSTSPSTAGMLTATFAKYHRYWTIWDCSFGALGKQGRHRTTSYNGASCSWAFIISPVSSSPPWYNHCLRAKTGVCLRKWSLDVCLIWTNSVTEHAAQRVWVTLTKQLPLLITVSKDWKESSIRGLSLKRCSVPMPGYQSALTPFFTRVLLPCFWSHRTALPLPECGGVERGSVVWRMGPFAHAVFLYFWTVGW